MAGEKNTKREWLELRTKETLVEFSLTKYLTLHDKKKKKKSTPSYLEKKGMVIWVDGKSKEALFDTCMAG